MYKSKFTGKQIDKILDFVNTTYDVISNEIRGEVKFTSSTCTFKLNGSEVITPEITDKHFAYVIPKETIVTSCASIFNGQKTIVSLDLSDFDMSNVTDISNGFNNCVELVTLDLGSSLKKVSAIYSAFYLCGKLTSLDLSNLDTSEVTSFVNLFSGCIKLTSLDLSNFNTSSAVNMQQMFSNLISVDKLDLSNFDTSNVTNMRQMFEYCTSLTSLDLSNFNTSKVTNMQQMFSRCTSLTSLDLSNFDTSKVTNYTGMFSNCTALNYIKCKQSFKDWCITNSVKINLPETMNEGNDGIWDIIN